MIDRIDADDDVERSIVAGKWLRSVCPLEARAAADTDCLGVVPGCRDGIGVDVDSQHAAPGRQGDVYRRTTGAAGGVEKSRPRANL